MESCAVFRARASIGLTTHASVARATNDPDFEPTAAGVEAQKAFQAALFDAGLAGITWPEKYGGRGLTNEHQRGWNEEAGAYELPGSAYTIGLGLVIPTIPGYGTGQQRGRHVREAPPGAAVWT